MPPGSVSFLRHEAVVGRVDFCEPQLNLLAHAQVIQLAIGSRCGGHGVCGGDRVRIGDQLAKTLSSVTEREREHLSPLEIAAGYRLACQCYPNDALADLSIYLEY